MKFVNEKITSGQSLGANYSTQAILLDQIFGFSFQAILTGFPDGVIKLQGSNDDVRDGSDVINWTDIGNSSSIITAASDVLWNVENCFYKWVRVTWEFSSGSGSLNVTYCGKGA